MFWWKILEIPPDFQVASFFDFPSPGVQHSPAEQIERGRRFEKELDKPEDSKTNWDTHRCKNAADSRRNCTQTSCLHEDDMQTAYFHEEREK
jgi:hypothetical protein